MKETEIFDTIIVGGGLAGLTAAIHLSKFNKSVLLFEKNKYPKHKVCGEYVSNEVLPYLKFLEIDPIEQGAKQIDFVQITTENNKEIKGNLPLGGFGISRYFFDNLLVKKAKEQGVIVIKDTVESIDFVNDLFSVTTKNQKAFQSKIALGAFGKRSSLDIKMNREFIRKTSPYLAVKTHVRGNFPENHVALHNFRGGYCGVSKVENDAINLCYITTYKSFKKHKNISDFQNNVLYKNKELKKVFENSTPVFDKPLTISQISFETKRAVENHIIMCGDTAGMIHPLCGNGMAMAITSAKIASEEILNFLDKKISRTQLEKNYITNWNKLFMKRLKIGHFAAYMFSNNSLSKIAYFLLRIFPSLFPVIIKKTHGKPLYI